MFVIFFVLIILFIIYFKEFIGNQRLFTVVKLDICANFLAAELLHNFSKTIRTKIWQQCIVLHKTASYIIPLHFFRKAI